MTGTKAGGKKWMQSMIEIHGSRQAVREHMREVGAKGGKAQVTKGFGSNPELARIAGAKGGRISRRRKKETI
ncbi:hypothetical protein [Rhodococcus erythropolis]|uniref:general stress protein n=1 Tax=Rhodococcus erythropolis TaxID=1833 RepID=UPI003013575B